MPSKKFSIPWTSCTTGTVIVVVIAAFTACEEEDKLTKAFSDTAAISWTSKFNTRYQLHAVMRIVTCHNLLTIDTIW